MIETNERGRDWRRASKGHWDRRQNGGHPFETSFFVFRGVGQNRSPPPKESKIREPRESLPLSLQISNLLSLDHQYFAICLKLIFMGPSILLLLQKFLCIMKVTVDANCLYNEGFLDDMWLPTSFKQSFLGVMFEMVRLL